MSLFVLFLPPRMTDLAWPCSFMLVMHQARQRPRELFKLNFFEFVSKIRELLKRLREEKEKERKERQES